MALENFLQNAANFATGGLYNNLSGRDKELQQQQLAEAEAFRVNPELVREAAKYDPSIMERLGNLLTGGIYGQASGMNDKLEKRAMAMKQIRDEEFQRRMEDRMNQYRMGPVQEPVGSEMNPDRSMAPTPVAPGTLRKKNTFAGGY
jgi:hypothetical protein